MRSRNMHRAGAWMKKRSRDKFALTHSSASLIHISGQLLTFSVLYTSFPYPTFLQNFILTPCVSVSFCPLSVGQGQGMTPSPIRKEKMDPKWRHICCFGRQQYGLTPSFGCCDGKCKCVAGVHNLVWEGEEGFILQWFLSGCKWCWSPWVFCITVGKQTSQVSSQTVHEKTIKQLNRQSATKGQEFSSHETSG